MKKLNILKTLLDLFWLFTLMTIVPLIIIIPMLLFNSEMNLDVNIKGQILKTTDHFTKIVIVLNVISILLFLYGIYQLRKVIIQFQKKQLFNNEIVERLNLTGKLIIISTILENVSFFIYNYFKKLPSENSININIFDSFLLSLIIGLFLIVISEIFKIAYNIKTESEQII
jgi:hypothetical protein